jgi:D-xylose transport system substrate-binding protein
MRFLLGFVFLILIISCKETKNQVGYLNWNGVNEIALNTLIAFKERAQQIGVEVIEKDAHNNENEQYAQAMELINQGIKVLVIKPVNSVMAAGIVREAHKKGVIIIANDQLIKNCDLDYYVTFDSRKVGEFMAREALAKKPKGVYVFLWGDKVDDNADLVKKGVLKVLQPHIDNGNIKVLYSNYIEAWSLENAEHEVDRIVRLSGETKIDAVMASCDDMARGAINILRKYNMLDNTFTAGQNADKQSLKLILQDEQTMTIAKFPKIAGYALAEFAASLVSNNSNKLNFKINAATFNGVHEVPSIFFDPVIVNKSNLEKVMFTDGSMTRKDLQ